MLNSGMSKLDDLTGRRFGKLTVIGSHESRNGKTFWPCRCDCGNSTTVVASNLKRGNTLSCGCLQRNITIARNTTHGLVAGGKPPEYIVWVNFRNRCEDPRDKQYPSYGGRGITVDARWQSYEAFYADMGPRPSADHQIDRIDNDGPYAPGNCRWATRTENCSNRRDNVFVEWHGESLTVPEWARRVGIKKHTIHQRLNKLGWDVERALTTPVRRMRRR